ncbi:MAG TPA: gamma-glutamyltransferase [Thermomicrobiales bacterium]|nr:gamma-glutamyltransferase [Thermomicrobiales bacterium]
MLGFPTSSSSRNYARRRPYPCYAERGMVAAAHPYVVETGLAVLRQGGNAVDAAVAAGLAAAVVMPEMCGLGGELFAVLSVGAEPIAVQASGKSARGASLDLMREIGGDHMPYTGAHSIAVPGMVDAYFKLLENYGTMTFARVAEPAVQLARNGFPLQPLGAEAIATHADLLARDEAAADIFLANGPTPSAGDRLVQTDLAETLEQLGRQGAESFYQGDLAERMTRYLQHAGGCLSVEDFAHFRTVIDAPYATIYRGHTVYQTRLPSQGVILLETLNIVENAELGDLQSADGIHTLVEAKKLAYADRLGHLADPDFHQAPVEPLLSKEWAKQRFDRIDLSQAATDVLYGEMHDGDTTYLCVIDSEGRMVSLIQSVSSSFGSGVVAGDTGVLMNNRVGRGFSLVEGHPNIYAPGKKTMHTLNCFLIADGSGRPVLVGGTPGGDGQPQWNLQLIAGMMDGGMDVQETIEQPRWTSWPGTDPSVIDNPFELRVENRLPDDVISTLEKRGHAVRLQDAWGGGGAAQIIARNPDTGLLIGGTDARVEGSVLGL